MLVALLFTAALVVGRAQEGVIAKLETHAPTIKRWTGAVLIVIGVWFLALAAFADFFADLFPV